MLLVLISIVVKARIGAHDIPISEPKNALREVHTPVALEGVNVGDPTPNVNTSRRPESDVLDIFIGIPLRNNRSQNELLIRSNGTLLHRLASGLRFSESTLSEIENRWRDLVASPCRSGRSDKRATAARQYRALLRWFA
jgi:hypothetical protein